MSLMLDEINEQPRAVADALERGGEPVAALVRDLIDRNIRHVVIAARGTSDNAATYARYLIEIVAGIPVTLAAPSVFTLYDARVDFSGCLVLGISQSGQATDVVQTLATARASGALTACITNMPNTPIVEVSDHALYCYAGEERSVAATKTYTTTQALLALLAGQWANCRTLLDGLRALPDQIAEVLKLDSEIAQLVERYRYIQDCAVLARGLNLATALEAALKMMETNYIVVKSYSGADFLHGPIAMISPGFPCFLYAPDGKAFPWMLDLAHKLEERSAEMIVFAHSDAILKLATRPIKIAGTVDEMLSPILYIVPGQLWACRLAGARGLNPDSPRGLSKVTLTR
jgi:glucosamine--fructose-6-phosphate aminotransferase (isomerizing)